MFGRILTTLTLSSTDKSAEWDELLGKARNRAADLEKAIEKIAEEFESLDIAIIQHTKTLAQLTDKAREEAAHQLRTITNKCNKSALIQESTANAQKAYISRSISSRGQSGKKQSIRHIITSLYSVVCITIPSNTVPPPAIQTALTLNTLSLSKEISMGRFIYEGYAPITRDITSITTQKRRGTYKYAETNRSSIAVAIAVHPTSGRVYIADTTNHCITILTPELKLHATYGSKGTLPSQFSSPIDISISHDGQAIAVADPGNRRIQIFDSDMGVQCILNTSIPGLEGNLLFTAVRFDEDGNLFAVMPYSGVVKLSRTGQFISSFGGPGSPYSVHEPYGLALDYEAKEVIVQSMGLSIVYVFGLDGTHHRTVKFDHGNVGANLVPCGDRRFALSQRSRGGIVFCDKGGRELHRLSVEQPGGSAFGPNGQFYVASCLNQSVTEF